MKSNILILDPAESCGFCMMSIDDVTKDANIYSYGFVEPDISSKFLGDWCISLKRLVGQMNFNNNFTHVVVEDYFFGSKFASGCGVNTAFRAAIFMWARENNIEYTIVNPCEWKKFIGGRSVPSKEQKAKWGKQAAKKLYIQQALWEKYGFRFPNYSPSQNTGKPIFFRYDIVDAVGQGIYWCRIFADVQKISMSVPVPDDVIFKKPPKNFFEYPKTV